MDYKKHYDKLIEKAKNRQLSGYKEIHHVIPKCMNGNDEDDNLVELTAEEHYTAHQLLAKIYPDNSKLLISAIYMTGRGTGNKIYGWLRRRWSEKMEKNNPNKNGKARLAYIKKYGKSPDRNWKLSDKGKQAIIDNMKNNNPNKGTMPWYHPRATKETKQTWLLANDFYKWWINNKTKSYSVMAKTFGYPKYGGPHMNMIKWFRRGWIPYEDEKWLNFSKEEA